MKVKTLMQILSKLPPDARIGIGDVSTHPEYVSTIASVSVHKETGVVALNMSDYGGTEHVGELEGDFSVKYKHPTLFKS